MKVFHCNNHPNCPHYADSGRPQAQIMTGDAGESVELHLTENEIVFVWSGRFRLSFDEVEKQPVVGRQIFLFPIGSVVKVQFDEPSRLLICRLKNIADVCDRYSITDLYADEPILKKEFTLLRFNERIENFVDHFLTYIEDGLWCKFFFEAKIREMVHLLWAYYPKEELARFFYPLMNSNTAFSSFVQLHYTEVKNVKEFADLAGYSLSGFGKRFQKVFGIAPSQWLRQKKAQRIYHDIKTSNKSFKQLCQEYDFSSLSHFNDFCKKIFGVPPGKIRGKTR